MFIFIRKRKVEEMQSLIDVSRKNLEFAEKKAKYLSKDLESANQKIEQKNGIIEKQDCQIKRIQERINKLMKENELFYNNLSPKKKALVRPDNQN